MASTRGQARGGSGGSYGRWLGWTARLVGPFVVVVLVMAAQFQGVTSEPALEQAVTARRLADGRGFTTDIITPRSVALHEGLADHPELRQAPLAVLPTAILLRLAGDRGDRVVVLSSMLAWLLAVWLAGWLAGRLFGPPAGVIALLMLTFGPAALGLAVSGDGRAWAMPALLLLWFVLVVPAPGMARPVLAGALTAVCCLIDYGLTLPLLIVVLACLWSLPAEAEPPLASPADDPAPALATRTPMAPLIALATLLIVCLPWLIRNQRVAGSPVPALSSWDLLNFTQDSPGRSIERRFLDPGATPLSYALSHKRQLVQKTLTGFSNLRLAYGQAYDGPVLALFLAALLLPLAGGRARGRVALAFAMLIHAKLIASGNQQFGELTVWMPLVAVWAAWVFGDRTAHLFAGPKALCGRTFSPAAWHRVARLILLTMIAVPGLAPQLFSPRAGTPASQPNWTLLSQLAGPDDVIMCDDPWRVAWATDRTCLWLAHTPEDLEALQATGNLRFVYFSQRALPASPAFSQAERGRWWSWAQIMPQGYGAFQAADSRVEGERILVRREGQ